MDAVTLGYIAYKICKWYTCDMTHCCNGFEDMVDDIIHVFY